MAETFTSPFNNLDFHDSSWDKTDKVMKYLGQFISRRNKLERDTSPSEGEGALETAIGFDENDSSIFLDLSGLINWVEIALENLNDVYEKCSEENWDGYGAVPISYQAFFEVSRLLRIFPSSLPMPDILPDPEGDIGLEWYNEQGFSFTVSLSGDNIISYAGLFGENNEAYGSEAFSDSVPKSILDNIKRLYSTIL